MMKEKIRELIDKKLRLKKEIARKGVDMTDAALADYGDRIRGIGGDGLYVSPFAQLGYGAKTEELYSGLDFGTLSEMNADFAYSRSLMRDTEPDDYFAYFLNNAALKYAPCMPGGGRATNYMSMFNGCTSLVSVPFYDLSLATDITNMFYNCISLEVLDAADWNTSRVTTMQQTFYNCLNIESVDLSGWDLSNVTTMYYMFSNCPALDILKIKGLGANANVDISGMFTNDTRLGASAAGLQALRDTLITDSFDRAAAGCPALTISLPTAVKARLTTSEIARITDKGFTVA